MIGQVVKIVSSHIKVLGWKPSTTWFQLLASAVLAKVIRSLLIHGIPALHSQFRALVPTAAGIYRMKQWTQTISLYFFVFFCFSNKIQNIFFNYFTLKTEQRTSAELVSNASSPVTFFRRSIRMVGGIISQYLEAILQTPRIPVERTIG